MSLPRTSRYHCLGDLSNLKNYQLKIKKFIGRGRWFETKKTDSTNKNVQDLILSSNPLFEYQWNYHPKLVHGDLFSAQLQTSGKGRLGRDWISPKPNKDCLFSIYLCFDHQSDYLSNISQIMAILICQYLRDINIKAKIKWPNDILVEGKKIAGILCEIFTARDADLKKIHFILGVGININSTRKEFKKISQPATSVKCLLNKTLNRNDFLFYLERYFLEYLDILSNNGFESFITDWKSFFFIPQKKVKLKMGNKYEWIQIIDSTNKGELIIINNDGIKDIINSGELLEHF